jgi:hypothetical protein
MVLVVGIAGLITALWGLPVGIVAWFLGRKELRGMKAGRIDPSGRTSARIGHVLGIAGTLLWILIVATLAVPGLTRVHESSETTYEDGSRDTKVFYPRGADTSGPSIVEWEYREVPRSNGAFVKEGAAIHWSRDGRKLEEGHYLDGKRDGPWTFWNPDGSIDESRSGIYREDGRVQAGPTPPGDYPEPLEQRIRR